MLSFEALEEQKIEAAEIKACRKKLGPIPENWDGMHICLDWEVDDSSYTDSEALSANTQQQVTWTVDPQKLQILKERGFTGSRVGIINNDTGWTPHQLLPEPKEKYNFTTRNTGDIIDRNGHGTHCIGSNLGKGNLSYSPGARLDGVGKCLSDSGYGGNTVASVNWAADVAAKHGSKLLSCSWGGGNSVGSSMQAALRKCAEVGLLPIFAAGNSGFRSGRSTVISPAISPYTAAVASHDSQFNPSGFSSAGPAVALSAGGSQVRSASHKSRTGLVNMSGTSMATPTAVSTLAVLFDVLMWLGVPLPRTIEELVMFLSSNEFLRDAGSRGFDWRFGHGILMVNAVIDYCINKTFTW